MKHTVESLEDRVLKFMMLELDGQPRMMHMGTSYLVQDLMAEVRRLTEAGAAQPVAVPVAWMARTQDWSEPQDTSWQYGPWVDGLDERFIPLYAHPAAQPAAEPTLQGDLMHFFEHEFESGSPLDVLTRRLNDVGGASSVRKFDKHVQDLMRRYAALALSAQPAAEPVDSLLGKLVGAAMDLEREQGANAGMDESSSAWQLVKSLERRVLKAANAAQPAAEPVATTEEVRSAIQQAALALEDLDGPGYLIGGVMHHRISLLLPMLNKALASLYTTAQPAAEPAFPHCKQCGSSAWMCSVCPQPAAQPAAEPLTDEQIDMMWRRAGIANNARGAFFAGVAAGEWLRRLGECLPHSNTPNVGVKTRP
jgi:hypothetical protein